MPFKILVIDDDVAMTELFSMLLQTHGFEVFVANNGSEGLNVMHTKKPQAVILDLMMPDMDGRMVCRAIRDFSNVPILILSALDDPELVASVLDSGADDYLVKPVTSGMLIARINRILKRTGGLILPSEPPTSPLRASAAT
ncbi:MAG: response regulator transcription factor [Chloroflexota bacterium]